MAETRLYVVRVWRIAREFRASVRGVDDAEPLLFTEPQQVADFLRDASGGPRDADTGGEGG